MGLGGDFVGDLERLMVSRVLGRKELFRMTGASSQCWRAESELERMYLGMRCLLLPSASVGLALLLEVLDLEQGGEVLIAPFGWLSNWSCIRRAGLSPRFLPLDRNLQLRPEVVAERISERTAAVVVTHLMGRGQQAVAEIARTCSERGVPLLEDVAQSLGVSIGGRRAGTFGAAAWCSLNHHKLISTGDGGFVLVRDAGLFDRLCALHDQGCVIRGGGRRRADDPEPGLSLRVTDLSAAVLRAQLARYHLVRARILARQRSVAEACEQVLGLELIPPCDGDLPFTVLFRRRPGMSYPSLAESGWHVAANVPWLADLLGEAARTDPAVDRTLEILAETSAVGAGFIDPYYSVPAGLSIMDELDAMPHFLETMERAL